MTYIYGRQSVLETLKSRFNNINYVLVDNFRTEEYLLKNYKDLKIHLISPNELSKITKSDNHQGIAAKTEELYYSHKLGSMLESKRIIILDKWQSPGNIGNIIRSAACFNFDIIIINHDSCGINQTACKIACGGIEWVKICNRSNLNNTLHTLKENNYFIIGTAHNGQEDKLSAVDQNQKIVLIIGSEEKGLNESSYKNMDLIHKIKTNNNFSVLNANNSGTIMMSYFYNHNS